MDWLTECSAPALYGMQYCGVTGTLRRGVAAQKELVSRWRGSAHKYVHGPHAHRGCNDAAQKGGSLDALRVHCDAQRGTHGVQCLERAWQCAGAGGGHLHQYRCWEAVSQWGLRDCASTICACRADRLLRHAGCNALWGAYSNACTATPEMHTASMCMPCNPIIEARRLHCSLGPGCNACTGVPRMRITAVSTIPHLAKRDSATSYTAPPQRAMLGVPSGRCTHLRARAGAHGHAHVNGHAATLPWQVGGRAAERLPLRRAGGGGSRGGAAVRHDGAAGGCHANLGQGALHKDTSFGTLVALRLTQCS